MRLGDRLKAAETRTESVTALDAKPTHAPRSRDPLAGDQGRAARRRCSSASGPAPTTRTSARTSCGSWPSPSSRRCSPPRRSRSPTRSSAASSTRSAPTSWATGPLQPFLLDPTVTEVMANNLDGIWVERAGKLELTDASFATEEHLRRVIERIVSDVGRRIDESQPMVDARLPDGSRVNAIIPPLAVDGPTLTIRKFAKDVFSASDIVADRHGVGRGHDAARLLRRGQAEHPRQRRHGHRQDDVPERALELHPRTTSASSRSRTPSSSSSTSAT